MDSDAGHRLREIEERIGEACRRANRGPDEVCLLAVSKVFPAEAVLPVWEAGQKDFGESRQQEGAVKVAGLPDDIRWHFIGKLQRNKVRKVLQDFQVLHSVDSLKLAAHIDRIAGELGCHPGIYLEVNLGEEERKGGFLPAEIAEAFSEISSFQSLKVEGLMAIPPVGEDEESARPWFVKLRELRDELVTSTGVSLDGLSMGMSSDFEIAIEEGATIVRVGSAIFGRRPVKTT